MPAIRSCNQAAYGRTFNTTITGTMGVMFEVRWVWDGVSVPDSGCDGPITNGGGQFGNWAVQATNPTDLDWYAHTTRKNGQPAVWGPIQPGQTVTFTANQVASNGFSVISDFGGLQLTTTP